MIAMAGARTFASVRGAVTASVRCGMALVMVAGLALSASAQGPKPRATVSGEVLPSGDFVWHVKNLSDSPIVEVIIPHFHGDMFKTPPGWKQDCTYLVNVGVPDRPGHCRAFVDEPVEGLRRHATADFELRIARAGAREGRGVVTLKFGDGSIVKVPDVLVPVAPHFTEYLVGPVGLAFLLGVAILFEVRRRRRQAAVGAKAPSQSE